MHIPAESIQVLTATRKGDTGTAALNRALQAALNPRVWVGAKSASATSCSARATA